MLRAGSRMQDLHVIMSLRDSGNDGDKLQPGQASRPASQNGSFCSMIYSRTLLGSG
jgi:hypothetical protein